MSTAIITTTIHKPVLLRDYCENAKRYNHEDVFFVVIGDKKTPDGVGAFCEELQREYGYRVDYLDVEDQLMFLDRWQKLRDHLPYNSIQRRNIGILKAYLDGAEMIITIDDDNFVEGGDDFIGRHSVVGKEKSLTCLNSSSGWFNVCEMLEEENDLPFFHRGFPWKQRSLPSGNTIQERTGKVIVNAGLWLDAPDIDAITWLDLPIKATRMSDRYPNGVALDLNTWSPFNSQNTALAREVIPAYFLSPNIGRYDDIWASYIVKKIADYLGHYINYGFPLVRQERNPHNYFNDLKKEQLGMELTDELVEGLRGFELTGIDYQECFVEITDWLVGWVRENELLQNNDQYRDQIEKMIEGMRIWAEVFNGGGDAKLVKSMSSEVEKSDKKIKINLGCGDRPISGFLNVDCRDIPSIEYPNTKIDELACFDDELADYVYASHVLEHIQREKTMATLLEWNRILKVGGMLRIAVPNWDSIIRLYSRTHDLTNLINFMYGGREEPSNCHYRMFNYEILRTLLWEAGFKRITKYDWRETEHAEHDDFSKAYVPHMDTENGILMSLNVQCIKHTNISLK
jgi:predicted SAM-dependent methyltransferase